MSIIVTPSGLEHQEKYGGPDLTKVCTIGTELVNGEICVSYLRPPVNDLIHQLLPPAPGAKPHIYKPLPPNCTRLLRRVKNPPRVDMDPYTMVFESFDFVTCDLANASAAVPSYSAISYCWGDLPTDKHVFLADGSYLPITEKVARILVRIVVDAEYIWLDAVCINQADVAEKALQIPLMAEIYRRAASVEVWLGKQDGINRVFSPSAENPFSIEQFSMDYKPDRHDPHSPYSPGKVIDLIWSPWFERAWVVQEFCFGRNHKYHFDDVILYPLFFDMILEDLKSVRFHDKAKGRCQLLLPPMIRNLPKFRQLWLQLALIDKTKEHKKDHEGGVRLEDILVKFYSLKATDPRDKVFAMLNFASAEAREDIKPDYTRHAADIYHDAMESVLFRGTTFQLLGFAGLAAPCPLFKERPNTSSWIPDLSTPPEHNVWSADPDCRGFKASAPLPQNHGISLNCYHIFNPGEIIDKLKMKPTGKVSEIETITKTYEHQKAFIMPQGKHIATVTNVLPGDPSQNLAHLPGFLSRAISRTKTTRSLDRADEIIPILRNTLIAENPACRASDPDGKGFSQLCDMILASTKSTHRTTKDKDEEPHAQTEQQERTFDWSVLWQDDQLAEARSYFQTMLTEGAGSTRGLYWAEPATCTPGANTHDNTEHEKRKKTKKTPKGRKKKKRSKYDRKMRSRKKKQKNKKIKKINEHLTTDIEGGKIIQYSGDIVGLAANGVQPGDEVWVLAGARVPFILRRRGDTNIREALACEIRRRCPGTCSNTAGGGKKVGSESTGNEGPQAQEEPITATSTRSYFLVCEAYLNGFMYGEVDMSSGIQRIIMF